MWSKSPTGKDLDLAEIEARLKTNWLGRSKSPNELWETIDSTNSRAIELARLSASSGVIVIAGHQSAGHGRAGNTWLSPANSGLYLSFLIRSKLAVEHLPVITLIAGVAVVRAIQSCSGIKVGLKWVNDLIVEGKKVGGILAEYVSGASENALVIGIGLNLTKSKQELSNDLEHKIGYLNSFMPNFANPKLIEGNELVASIANELEIAVEQMQLELQLLLDQWRAYSVTLGEEIVAIVGNEKIIGQALDITEKGELIVKTKSGNITLTAGELSIRKSDGSYV